MALGLGRNRLEEELRESDCYLAVGKENER